MQNRLYYLHLEEKKLQINKQQSNVIYCQMNN